MFASFRPLLAVLAVLAVSFAALIPAVHGADQPNAAEAKLRETLRNTLIQARTLQGEKDALQAEKDALDAEFKALQAKLDDLKKTTDAAKIASDNTVGELNKEVAGLKNNNAYLKETSEKFRKSFNEAAALAEKKEAARAKLNSENIVLQRHVADQFRKNQEMFRIGNEILTRYENFSLGTALTAREPFVGTTRVKLQNLVQDYADKLQAERLKAVPTPANSEPEPGPRKPAPKPEASKPAPPKAKPAEKSTGPAQPA